MKYKLLSVGKDKELPPSINIGDYVQALAASQFLPTIDGFIDRDNDLKSYDGDECKVIMNGWYMHKPQNWPPSSKIIPLFVAFHINSAYKEFFKKKSSIDYLKQYEPIGCRDPYTLEFLKSQNVKAYFSACLTLTLGEKYTSIEKGENIYFVDPYVYYCISLSEIVNTLFSYIFNFRCINSLAKKFVPYKMEKNLIRRIYGVSCFYRQYSKVFPKNILLNARYISHISKEYRERCPTERELLKEAERLIINYSKAKLVITSRIHCALPCLGIGTNVIFVKDANLDESNASRLNGLTSFFNILDSRKGILSYNNKKVNYETILNLHNDNSWEKYSDDLKRRCSEFVNS
ncbi:MAG: polysaccharide pyruvyl transferase family protein [Bacteroidales bacterium]|nr:polysaccharide pyruvyl transferase family protein [Bacteroidales bacterium]